MLFHRLLSIPYYRLAIGAELASGTEEAAGDEVEVARIGDGGVVVAKGRAEDLAFPYSFAQATTKYSVLSVPSVRVKICLPGGWRWAVGEALWVVLGWSLTGVQASRARGVPWLVWS